MNTIPKIGLIIFLLLTTKALKAQDKDFRPGYIIKNSLDTIHGEIDFRGELSMSKECAFRSKDSIETKYTPLDLHSYRFVDGKYYISKEVDNEKVFLEYLVNGKTNIYYLRNSSGNHYYIDKDGIRLSEIPYEEKTIDKEGQVFEKKSTKHIGILNIYMNDAPNFSSKINNIKEPSHKNLIKLASDYHAATCNGENCIIYGKTRKPIRIFLEPTAGITNHFTKDYIGDRTSTFYSAKGNLGYGIFIHIWVPRTNEKIYLKTGYIQHFYKYRTETTESTLDLLGNRSYYTTTNHYEKRYHKIPFQAEYIRSTGAIKPKIAYGIALYYPLNTLTNEFNGGLNIKISENIHWSLDYNLSFRPSNFVIIPKSAISNSFLAGLFIQVK